MKLLAKLILWLSGWKVEGDFPKGAFQCVIIAAPHTSNWDFLYARAALFVMDIPVRFTIKREYMRFPLGFFMKKLGAIPIDRSKRKGGMVNAMVELFGQISPLAVLVTPEGTRNQVKEWRTGFYYVALEAGVPLLMGYLDYKRKAAGLGPYFYPVGDYHKDLNTIQEFYKNITPKYPDRGLL